jgi:IS5 family transposase
MKSPPRQFAGLSLFRKRILDETTTLNFRHLLEQHQLGKQLFDEVSAYLGERRTPVTGRYDH